MVTKVFNIQPVLFHQYYLCHILWFKKQSFTSVWKPNPPLLSPLRAPSRSCWCSECRLYPWSARAESASLSCDQWNLTPATMCCGSAARRNRRFGAADHALAHVRLTFSISSSFSLSFSPSLASLYLFEQCLRLGVRGTSSVCLPLQD